MPSYLTPGVYIEEIPVFPPSVAPVATAIPAFIGYTAQAVGKQGENLTGVPVRLESLLDYEAQFGKAPVQALDIVVTEDPPGTFTAGWSGTPPAVPTHFMHYALQLYFANGGGPCYIYSVGPDTAAVAQADFTNAILALEAVDEPTLLVFPDALTLTAAQYGAIVSAALQSCNRTQDRFTIADVHNAVPGGTEDNADVDTNFRSNVPSSGVEFLKYGAGYFPYLRTLVPFNTTDADVTLVGFGGADVTLDNIATTDTAAYAAARRFVDQAFVTVPPSGAIAGVYAQVDRARGVWKAPANVGLALVSGPAVPITNSLQDGLNVDATSGKSVNAVRAFFGKGTLVWGARTLAGNDNENRYINVRRFLNFVEESVEKAIGVFVFEPNNALTWVKVRTMIENFLTNQWRDGALMGAKPEHAFRVAVGLGQTMTADDILNGLMIVEVHLAIVRPAEFIVLRFMQKMPES
jgi:phage tail sheath protein FI